jgi:dTDP-glucose 4,6-dehydratase
MKNNFRFLHVSTDKIYGSLGSNDPAFIETNQYKLNSPYSASKVASDNLVRAYYKTSNIPVLTTNCYNNYGLFLNKVNLI